MYETLLTETLDNIKRCFMEAVYGFDDGLDEYVNIGKFMQYTNDVTCLIEEFHNNCESLNKQLDEVNKRNSELLEIVRKATENMEK